MSPGLIHNSPSSGILTIITVEDSFLHGKSIENISVMKKMWVFGWKKNVLAREDICVLMIGQI